MIVSWVKFYSENGNLSFFGLIVQKGAKQTNLYTPPEN